MFRVAVPCTGCGARAPVDRPQERLPCPRCGRTLRLDAATWRELVARARASYDTLADDHGHQGSEAGGQMLDWVLGRKQPTCAACGAALARHEAPGAPSGGDASAGSEARCGACGVVRARERPPTWLASFAPDVREVLPASHGAQDACFFLGFDEPQPAHDPLVQTTLVSPSPTGAARVTRAVRGLAERLMPARDAATPTALLDQDRQKRKRRALALAAGGVAVAGAFWAAARDAAPPSPAAVPAATPRPSGELRKAKLEWRASVLQVEGWPLEPGTQCVAALEVTSDGDKLRGAALAIHCGDAQLHGPRATTPPLECMLFEGPAFDSRSHEYDAACKRLAPGAEVPQLLFDTRRRRAVLTSTDPAYRVELELQREDGEREGPALFGNGAGGKRSFREPVLREGSVVRARDGLGVEVGDRCQVALAPTPLGEMPCRVRVRCGARQLYGGFGQGFTHCVIADGSVTIAMDDGTTSQDGDPRLRVDLPAGRVTVTDALPDREIRIELD